MNFDGIFEENDGFRYGEGYDDMLEVFFLLV